MHEFAGRLKEALRDRKMSQVELARRIQMSQVVVNNYCTGAREPSLTVLCLISKELNETTDYLLGLTDD
jgi:transcriptional regulator with XRE-family HTH domain